MAMITHASLSLRSVGHTLDMSPEAWGTLTPTDNTTSGDGLRRTMEEQGYLYVPGLADRDEVIAARHAILRRLHKEGSLHPDHSWEEAVAHPEVPLTFKPDLAVANPELEHVLYADGGPVMTFFERFLDHAVLHFDFTWLRAMSPGNGTCPHCDIVYMGRGTHNLYTMWLPLGDVTYDIGGLMILEDSHLKRDRIAQYLEIDVDSFCSNRPESVEKANQGHMLHSGILTNNPVSLREKLGGRWLSAEYRMGDALIFPMHTIHASVDNQSDRVRISSDSRYQRADEPADERWVGPNPVAHSKAGKRGRIC